MTRANQLLPSVITTVLIIGALIHGPIAQLPHYHDFADQTMHLGIPHFSDVVSNLGFLLIALWGYSSLAKHRTDQALANGWSGYRLFLIALLLTSIGSTYYHLAPDNARLVWDRLPIALACGGLLAGVWGDTHDQPCQHMAIALALAAVGSVAWWHVTELAGHGDLRPYLLLQTLPILLIPLWQWSYAISKNERWYFSVALVLYTAAKWAELNDHEIGAIFNITGHTLKHLLATLACASIINGLNHRVRSSSETQSSSVLA